MEEKEELLLRDKLAQLGIVTAMALSDDEVKRKRGKQLLVKVENDIVDWVKGRYTLRYQAAMLFTGNQDLRKEVEKLTSK